MQHKTKSRTFRRVKVRTPKGKVTVHYKARKPPVAVCQNCKKPLPGSRRAIPSKMAGRMSSKRASRPYSSYCTRCACRMLIEVTRK